MGLPQTMYLNGYMLIQAKNYHVTVKTFEDNRTVGHFQCDHELSAEELIELSFFIKDAITYLN